MATPLKRSRRTAAVLAIPLTAALLLSACSKSSSSTAGSTTSSSTGGSSSSSSNGGGASSEPQTISFAISVANTSEHYFQDTVAAYEKLHPGVTINILKLPGESYTTAISTRVQAGNAPDVFVAEQGSGQADGVGLLGKAGLLLELDDSFKAGLPTGDDPATFGANGKLYSVPIASAVNGIVYNDDLAKQSGVTITATSTLEDVIKQCSIATAKGLSIFGLAGAIPANPGIATLELATSTVYGPTPDWDSQRTAGKVKFATSDGWKAALTGMQNLYKSNCFQKGAAGAGFDALTNGASQNKLFGFFAPSGAAKSIMDAAGGHVKLVVLPFPAPAGTPTLLSLSSDTVVTGSAKTKSPELVRDFLKYFISDDGKKVLANAYGAIPVNTTDTSSLLPQYAPVADLIKAKSTRGFPTVNWPNGKVYDALGSGVTGLFTGQKSVDDILQAMDKAWG